jgi:polar amino acid transport system substrate-binding protein
MALPLLNASANENMKISDVRVMRVAVEPTPPFSSIDEHGNISGLDKDLADALLLPLGYQVETVSCPWVRCLRMVEQGQVDMIFGLFKTTQREKKFLFLEPPFMTSNVTIANYQLSSASFDVHQLEDFHKLEVGIQRGALHFLAFDNDPLIKKTELKDIPTMINMLLKGRINTFVMPTVAADEYLAQLDKTSEIKRGKFTHIEQHGGHIALSRMSQHINDANRIMKQIEALKQSGHLHAILNTYHVE